MARRTFDVIDICEILVHWHAGRSKNEIAGSLGLSRNTVRKYVAAAEAAGMVPGGGGQLGRGREHPAGDQAEQRPLGGMRVARPAGASPARICPIPSRAHSACSGVELVLAAEAAHDPGH